MCRLFTGTAIFGLNFMKLFKKISILLISLFLMANAAMPGFWNVGGGGAFIPYFEKDSVYLDKVQMESELITIMLYKGFAVVKGEYYMKNLSKDSIILNTGYPINSVYQDKTVYSVHFDDLYNLKVFVDDKKVTNKRLGNDSTITVSRPKYLHDQSNWYVWESLFKADTISKITVYFMVNTNDGILREGYSRDYHNGFTYILESGKAWANKIDKGRIFIQLNDGLKISDITGILPKSQFKADEKEGKLIYDFQNLEPDSSSNILIRYGKRDERFDFEAVEKKSDQYYAEIDKIKAADISTAGYKVLEANDFEVHDWKSSGFFYVIMFILMFGMPLALVVLGLMTLYFYLFRRKKKES